MHADIIQENSLTHKVT